MNTNHTVSVVIPTQNRPASLATAIASVLGQTHSDVEIVVVVDGPNAPTEDLLRSLGDPRVRWIVNPTNVGTCAARNIGVREARGRWVGFLDDDDEWLPLKLARQIALLADADEATIASGRIIRRTPYADFVGPRHAPRAGEHVSEWLFRPRPPLEGATRFQPSAVLVPRNLALEVPWDPSLRFYEGHDWLLRAVDAGARLVLTDAPVYIWNIHDASASAAKAADWRGALAFIEERRHLVTERAYVWFVLDRVASRASIAADRPPLMFLLRKARAHGAPSAIDVARYLVRMTLPSSIRHGVRRAWASARRRRTIDRAP